MATTMVAEKEGSARPKALMAKILEAVVAILGLSSGCFIMGFACAHLRLKGFFWSAPPPISLRAGLQHHFPTFRHMEIGDRESETGTKTLHCGDRRSEIGSEPLQGRDRRSEIGRAFKASGG